MLTLLALASAAGTPSCGFNGGALVGAQAGFMHIMHKKLAKDGAITKDMADTKVKLFADAVGAAAAYDFKDSATDKAAYDNTKDFDNEVYTLKIDLTALKAAGDDLKAAAGKVVDAFNTALRSESFAKAKTVKVLVLHDKAKADFSTVSLNTQEAVKAAVTDSERTRLSKSFVDADAELKYTSNNGFAGIHVGYLGRVNEKFLAGGVVEGNWVFGQDIKQDSVSLKDYSARFNANVFLRAMFNLTEKFLVGADLGASFQEIRKPKDVQTGTTTDKESKWFWGPAARLVLGVALTDNILATAHVGGVFPIKQDHWDKSFKAKYSNFHGGVGISYAFGG